MPQAPNLIDFLTFLITFGVLTQLFSHQLSEPTLIVVAVIATVIFRKGVDVAFNNLSKFLWHIISVDRSKTSD